LGKNLASASNVRDGDRTMYDCTYQKRQHPDPVVKCLAIDPDDKALAGGQTFIPCEAANDKRRWSLTSRKTRADGITIADGYRHQCRP